MDQQNNKLYGNNRNYTFDNIKVILIFLVVFGHLINVVYTEKPFIIQIIWIIIYTFHMPLFVLISGYFSKGYSVSLKADKILTGLVIPYFVFNTIFCILDKKFIITILPDSAMWYLYALIIWRVLLPYLKKIKYVLPLTIFIAFLTIFIPTEMDSGSLKVIKYLPFFLTGYYITPELFIKLKNISKLKATLCFIFTLTCLSLAFYVAKIDISENILYVKQPSDSNLNINDYLGKIITLLFGLSVCFYMIIIIPNEKFFITSTAKYTLMIYLFHYIPIIRKIYKLIIPTNNFWLSIGTMILLSFFIVWFFSREFINKAYLWFMNKINKIFILKHNSGSESNV